MKVLCWVALSSLIAPFFFDLDTRKTCAYLHLVVVAAAVADADVAVVVAAAVVAVDVVAAAAAVLNIYCNSFDSSFLCFLLIFDDFRSDVYP